MLRRLFSGLEPDGKAVVVVAMVLLLLEIFLIAVDVAQGDASPAPPASPCIHLLRMADFYLVSC